MADIDTPPTDPVWWAVRCKGEVTWFTVNASISGDLTVHGKGQTAWLAYHHAREQHPILPPFGSCVVERVGGGK